VCLKSRHLGLFQIKSIRVAFQQPKRLKPRSRLTEIQNSSAVLKHLTRDADISGAVKRGPVTSGIGTLESTQPDETIPHRTWRRDGRNIEITLTTRPRLNQAGLGKNITPY